MRVFHTKYDVAPAKEHIMDRTDNVDRLSYVDSSLMIKRFVLEGQNLALHRARALASGLYSLEELKNDDNCPPVPVYEQDPVILQALIESGKSEFEERAKQSESNSDLVKEEPSSGSESDLGPATVD